MTVDKEFVEPLLKVLGYKIDRNGYITMKGKRILSVSNKPIKVSEFEGILSTKSRIYYLKGV